MNGYTFALALSTPCSSQRGYARKGERRAYMNVRAAVQGTAYSVREREKATQRQRHPPFDSLENRNSSKVVGALHVSWVLGVRRLATAPTALRLLLAPIEPFDSPLLHAASRGVTLPWLCVCVSACVFIG